MQSVALHEIVAIPGRGNALVAAQLIRKGEVIFTEKPSIWHSRSKSEGFCSTCGKSIRKQGPNCDAQSVSFDIIRCSQSQRSSRCVNATSRSIGGSSTIDGSSNSSYNQYCCQSSYCSIFCRDKADYDGHRWLCGEASAERYKELTHSDDDEQLGHLGLALTTYCQIAALYVRNLNEKSQNMTTAGVGFISALIECSPLQAADQIFDGYHKADYCRLVHAYRGGSNMISDEIFESVISPAYFSSRLESPLGIIKSFFTDQIPWGCTLAEKEQMEMFLDSEIFSDSYFRGMMGTYMSNVLHIRIENEQNRIDRKVGGSDGHSDNHDVDVDDDEKATIDVENNHHMETTADLFESEEQEQDILNKRKNFGVGLFHLYSKLNHSCSCNTVNQGGSEAEVTLIATSDIPMGTEITTTYLQHVLQDASRKIRKQALSQYMFVCECEKCQRELGENKAQKSLKRGVNDDHQSDDSSDDDY